MSNVPTGIFLSARLFPVDDPPLDPIELLPAGGVYTGLFHSDQPALGGYIHVWVEEAPPRREIITDYAIGGNPGHIRGRLGHIRGRLAPAISADGQVILFGPDLDLDEGQFLTLQVATVVTPPAPPWATAVGPAYHLIASANLTDTAALSQTSILFSYLGSEVPPGEEQWLRLYYLAPTTTTWRLLPTHLDVEHNAASARVPGEGLYLLMSSIAIPLDRGWNLFAYPIPETRPVAETLLSIEGSYGLVYGYDPADPADPWKVYGSTAPAWVNDLTQFEFGRGYWISTTEAITLYLKSAGGKGLTEGFPVPPATYYGPVGATATFTPVAGMTVTAWVEGKLCGDTQTLEVAGEVVYVLAVLADDQTAGCGVPGKKVVFRVGAQVMRPTVAWGNNRIWAQPLWPNTPPNATNDQVTTAQDTPVLIYVLINDRDPDGDPLTVIAVGEPTNGSVSTNGNTVIYAPTLGFTGTEIFDYTIGDPPD